MNKLEESVQVLRKATNKWHPCDEKAKALDYILTVLTNYQTAHEDMAHIISMCAHNRCDYCVCGDVPCPAQGLNAECGFEYTGRESAESALKTKSTE